MKRYEKMGLNTDEVLEEIFKPKGCNDCIAIETDFCLISNDCVSARMKALTKKIKIVPRIATINTVEELEWALKDYKEYCEMQKSENNGCRCCKYDGNGTTANCFARYLSEEIEVEE